MRKIVEIVSAILIGLVMSGCSNTLESITIEGATSKTVNVGETFNVLEGITVIGSDNEDYTESLTVQSFACGFDESNNLYTSSAKTCDITYIAVVSGKYVRESITITIK